MRLTKDTLAQMRRIVRAFRRTPVHETAVVCALADEHPWPEVAATAPLHVLSCAGYGKEYELLKLLEDSAVPFLRAPVLEGMQGSMIVQHGAHAQTPVSTAAPLLFPSSPDRIHLHMEERTEAINRAEIARKITGAFLHMLEGSGVNLSTLPNIPGIRRVILRQVFFGSTLCAPALYSFLVYVSPAEFKAAMRLLGAFTKRCAKYTGTDRAREVAQILCGPDTTPPEVRLVSAVKSLGF